MKKTFCDWCGKEAHTHIIKLPGFTANYNKEGQIKGLCVTGGEGREADICTICANKILCGMSASSIEHIFHHECVLREV